MCLRPDIPGCCSQCACTLPHECPLFVWGCSGLSDVPLTPPASSLRHRYHAGLVAVDLLLPAHAWGFVERAYYQVRMEVFHGVLIMLSYWLCVVSVGHLAKKPCRYCCIFPLTSLGFVLNSCYPLVTSIFFAKSLGTWELLSSGR